MNYSEYFGEFGGRYVPSILEPALKELEKAFIDISSDIEFKKELEYFQKTFIGRPTPLYYAENLTKALGGAKIYFKCEGLAHTGAHKINNALGQCMLAKRMGKKKIIAETGAGQHGVASASAAAKLGLECDIYMGAIDVKRQRPNVYTMQMFGANVVSVETGNRGLADAVDAALESWVSSLKDTHYLLGSAVGPAPFPSIVREFQSVVGKEARSQASEAGLDVYAVIAAVGGGSNAMGIFSGFLDDINVKLIGVEGGGRSDKTGDHAKRLAAGSGAQTGVHHGFKSKFLLDDKGGVLPTHSISAGLDYPGVGPEVAYLASIGRLQMTSARDNEVLDALKLAASSEGILFALESAHALAELIKITPNVPKDKAIIVNMSGRGDKDIFITAPAFNRSEWVEFLRREIGD
ncbi:MAG: tryptophan synthase subunit beta [Mucispirillum sp.]|nr:tryptophan synthase subunit beta [Mucispirillum sp.]